MTFAAAGKGKGVDGDEDDCTMKGKGVDGNEDDDDEDCTVQGS